MAAMMNEPIIGTIDFFDHTPTKEEKIEVSNFVGMEWNAFV